MERNQSGRTQNTVENLFIIVYSNCNCATSSRFLKIGVQEIVRSKFLFNACYVPFTYPLSADVELLP